MRAQPDGYTLLFVDTSPTINATLYDKLSFNFIGDLAPVAGIAQQPNVVVVTPSFPANTIPAFIGYARANPGRINFASAGNGNMTHMAGEIFKMMTGVSMVHVPYRGTGPALTDLLAGQVQVMFASLSASIEYIRADTLRALAVTTVARLEALPDIPTVREFVPGYETADWKGVLVPKNTPPEIIDKLNSELNAALADPDIKMRLADLGFTPIAGKPADFAKMIAAETDKWGKVVKALGIKAD